MERNSSFKGGVTAPHPQSGYTLEQFTIHTRSSECARLRAGTCLLREHISSLTGSNLYFLSCWETLKKTLSWWVPCNPTHGQITRTRGVKTKQNNAPLSVPAAHLQTQASLQGQILFPALTFQLAGSLFTPYSSNYSACATPKRVRWIALMWFKQQLPKAK